MVGDHHLCPGFELQGSEDRIDAGGGILNENQIFGLSAHKLGEFSAGAVPKPLQIADEKIDRTTFHALSQPGLGLENRRWAASKRAVIEEIDPWIERPDGI